GEADGPGNRDRSQSGGRGDGVAGRGQVPDAVRRRHGVRADALSRDGERTEVDAAFSIGGAGCVDAAAVEGHSDGAERREAAATDRGTAARRAGARDQAEGRVNREGAAAGV